MYGYRESTAILGDRARSWQTHNNVHIYQQYAFDKALTGFWTIDANRQRDAFRDDSIARRANFYPSQLIDLRNNARYNFNRYTTDESTIYWQIDNKIGWKGRWKAFNYQAYLKNRLYDWRLRQDENPILRTYTNQGLVSRRDTLSKILNTGFETFVGGKVFILLKDSTRFTIEAEHLLGKDYQIIGKFESKWFSLQGKSMLYTPSLLQRQYVSNHFVWSNNFSNIFLNEIEAKAFWKNDFISLEPYFRYQVIGNYVYFGENTKPIQTNEILQMTLLGGNVALKLRKLKIIQNLLYFQNLGANLFRAPNLSYWARIYCEDCLFQSKIQSQFGIEGHYKTDYQADAYMPVAKQFYLQNQRFVQGFWYLEAFANVKISNFRIFGKLSNILNFQKYNSFEVTPNYPALPFTFTFGINWMFFD